MIYFNKVLVSSIILIFTISYGVYVPILKNVKEEVVENILCPLWDSAKKSYKKEKSVIVLKVSKENQFTIKASVLYKDDFSWYLSDKKDQIFGLCKYEEIPVLVFGTPNACSHFFRKSELTTFLSYIDLDPKFKVNDKLGVDIEPEMFEPEVWVFSIGKDKFKLVEKDVIPLLE